MDRKQSVIANVKYQSPKGKGAGKLKGILRYIQYRDDRDGHIPQERGLERWGDHGLGPSDFQTIAANCEALKSEHVQAFTLVINPNPDLVAFVTEDQREDFVRELTENTIESFFEAREIDTPEWSYALHRRETTDDGGRDNPHTHVILSGTYESWSDGGRLPLYFNNRKQENHIEMLHQAAQMEIGLLLDRYIGPDWEQHYDALHPEVDQTELIQETEIEELPPAPDDQPHLTIFHDGIGEEIQTWVAIQGDLEPDVYHVGFIIRGEGERINNQVFKPRAENLTKQQAETLAGYMKQLMQLGYAEGYTHATDLADLIDQTERHQRDEVLEGFASVFSENHPPHNIGVQSDIDI